MPHAVVIGRTRAGKSTFIDLLAVQWAEARQAPLIYLDPKNQPRAEADLVTDDEATFLDFYWANFDCVAVIEEAGETVGRSNEEMRRTATRGAGHGHQNIYVLQYAADMSRSVRSQAYHYYIFNIAPYDAKILSQELHREVIFAPALPVGHFIHITMPGGKPEYFKVDMDKKDVVKLTDSEIKRLKSETEVSQE
jgi:hypothetical protein